MNTTTDRGPRQTPLSEDPRVPHRMGLEALENYVRMTAVRPRPDLVDVISRRISEEPTATAPKRLLGALAALDVGAVIRGIGQNVQTAFGTGRHPVWLRLQAAALVVVMVAGLGFASVAGVTGARIVLDELSRPPIARVPVPVASPQLPAEEAMSAKSSPAPAGGRTKRQPPRSKPAADTSGGSKSRVSVGQPKSRATPVRKRQERDDKTHEAAGSKPWSEVEDEASVEEENASPVDDLADDAAHED